LLIIVQNLPVPFDRRVWAEATTLRDAEYVNDMTIRFSVCIGTFRRPSVVDTAKSLLVQEGVAPSEMEIIVADDDPDYSARPAIEVIAKSASVAVRYVKSAARNISACRNACLRAARADWIAFIDDDQVAEPSWLREMIAGRAATGIHRCRFGCNGVP
jgi:succinoglycan biosynthesis protein ExoM